MKRLALILASTATFLGTACGASPAALPAPGSVDIGWSFRRFNASGAVAATYSCATPIYGTTSPLVYDVVVSFDGGPGQAVPCNDGVGDGGRFDNLAPGPHTVVVSARESIGGNLVPAFTAQTSFSVASGQLYPIPSLPLDGIPGNLEVWGALFDATGTTEYSCGSNSTASFAIADSVGTVVATGSAACALAPSGYYEYGVGFTGSTGLDLDSYTIRMTAVAGTYDSATWPACSGQPFAHVSTNNTGNAGWFPVLYYVGGNTTVCP